MGSCKTEAAMQACIGGSCSATECILSGNRQEKTLIQADITFVEVCHAFSVRVMLVFTYF